jgi:stage III sporulation protein AG
VSKFLERLTDRQKKLLSWLSLAVLVGVGLFLIQPGGTPEKPFSSSPAALPESPHPFAAEARYLESRLEELLSAVAGVRRAQVFVTLERGTRLRLAEELTVEEQGGVERRRTSSPALLRSGQSEEPIVLEVDWPAVQGVLVVADGAEDPELRFRIAQAVQTVLQIEMYRIEVLPRN